MESGDLIVLVLLFHLLLLMAHSLLELLLIFQELLHRSLVLLVLVEVASLQLRMEGAALYLFVFGLVLHFLDSLSLLVLKVSHSLSEILLIQSALKALCYPRLTTYSSL